MIRISFFLASLAVVLTDSGRNVPERDLLRGYAFASCLAEGYRGTPFAEDANRVAEMYRAAGKATVAETYQGLRQAAKDAHPESRAVVDKANLAIMVCLEFYESKGLRALIARNPAAKK
jgi:hypothetical protein